MLQSLLELRRPSVSPQLFTGDRISFLTALIWRQTICQQWTEVLSNSSSIDQRTSFFTALFIRWCWRNRSFGALGRSFSHGLFRRWKSRSSLSPYGSLSVASVEYLINRRQTNVSPPTLSTCGDVLWLFWNVPSRGSSHCRPLPTYQGNRHWILRTNRSATR